MPDESPRLTATRESGKALPCPEARAELGFREQYTQSEFDLISQGVVPLEMEDKWFIFYDAPWLFLHRSWTGVCIYALRFECSEAGALVAESWVNRDRTQYPETRVDYDRAVVKFLIDVLLLGRQSPFPIPENVLKSAPTGVFQHAVVGRSHPEVTLALKGQEKRSWWRSIRNVFKS